MRLQSDLEDRHASEIEGKDLDIAELTDMVEELAARLRDFEVREALLKPYSLKTFLECCLVYVITCVPPAKLLNIPTLIKIIVLVMSLCEESLLHSAYRL